MVVASSCFLLLWGPVKIHSLLTVHLCQDCIQPPAISLKLALMRYGVLMIAVKQ